MKSPNQTLIKEAAVSEALHLGADWKTKSKNVSGNVLLLSVCFASGHGPRCCCILWKRCTWLQSCMQQQCTEKFESIWGSCYSRRKAVLREWKQSFWLLTNICHTFLLLVPYSWSHQAIMKDGMDRQVSSAVAWDLTLQLIISSLCRMWCVGTTGILGSAFTLHPVFPMAAADRLLIFLLINQNNFEEKIRGSFPIHSSP